MPRLSANSLSRVMPFDCKSYFGTTYRHLTFCMKTVYNKYSLMGSLPIQ